MIRVEITLELPDHAAWGGGEKARDVLDAAAGLVAAFVALKVPASTRVGTMRGYVEAPWVSYPANVPEQVGHVVVERMEG